jgi:hypothetical protein
MLALLKSRPETTQQQEQQQQVRQQRQQQQLSQGNTILFGYTGTLTSPVIPLQTLCCLMGNSTSKLL